MRLFIDSHVHIYPVYDPGTMFARFASRALTDYGADAGVMMLAQREGAPNPPPLPPGVADITVIPGRQIACAERVEILALGTETTFKDGIPARDAVRAAFDAGALPVLAWGVGKWMFKRAKVVEDLLAAFKPSELAIGDTSMRPVFWPEPRLMRQARNAGYRILHGSDLLPPKDEETRAGQFGDIIDTADFDPSSPPVPQILNLLRTAPLATAGRRAGPLEFARRMTGK